MIRFDDERAKREGERAVAPTHQEIDARSLAMHRLIAEKVRRDPALFEKAKATLERWRASATKRELKYLDVWHAVFREGMEAALALAEEDSERGRTLRQSAPFAGILTEKERLSFLELSDSQIAEFAERLSRPEVQEAIFPLGTPDRGQAIEKTRDALRELGEERARRGGRDGGGTT